MPAFHDMKLLFVHIPKTAGMSIEHALGMRLRWPQLDKKFIFGPYDGQQLQHLTCRQILDYGFLTEKKFDTYFKFAFVRDPYDRLISEYFFDRRWNERTKGLSISQFLGYLEDKLHQDKVFAHYRPQSDFIFDDVGELMVDFVGYFENLDQDWERLRKLTGLHLPNLEVINRGGREHYSSYFDKEIYEQINNIYSCDFSNFGYEMVRGL